MEIYDGPYFRINKRLMVIGGLWPYERKAKKYLCRLCCGITTSILTLPQLYGLYKNFGVDAGKTIEHLALLIFMFASILKLVTAIMAEDNLKKVYDSIADNWIALRRDNDEMRILAGYSENGLLLTKGYIVYCLVASAFYVMLPLAPPLLNYVDPAAASAANSTRRRPGFVFNGEFPVDDMYDYYLEIFAFDVLGCCSAICVVLTVDTMYACCIEHCLGLFAIIKHRLALCTKYTHVRTRDVAYELIVEVVKLHKKTIERRDKSCKSFTGLFQKSYSMSFFMLMGMNMLYLSLVSVLLLLRKNEMMELIRYGGVLCGLVIHLFYLSWPGQKLIDHSTGLFDDAYVNDWYGTSREAQHLLRFMRLRCLTPCQLTAGGIYVMNFENFAKIIKTSVSYITVFSSFT